MFTLILRKSAGKKTILLLLLLLLLTNFSDARPISVDLMETLKTSEKILKIRVISIKNRILRYENLKTRSIDSVFTFGTRRVITDTNLSGTLPELGDTVIIVVTEPNEVCLFAKKTGDSYRFWSPFVANSSTLFYYTRPAQGLANTVEGKIEDFESENNKEYFNCFDGCILKSKFFEKKNGCFRKKGFEKFVGKKKQGIPPRE